MTALTQWVDQLEARVEKVADSRRAVVPPERFNQASVFLEQLVVPFSTLSCKHRFARIVTGSVAGVDLEVTTATLRSILQDEFQAFVRGHLAHGTNNLGDQVRALRSVIETQTKMLDNHVDSYRKRMAAEIESVNVQVKLFKALSIADYTAEYSKVQLQFTMLTRQYGEHTAVATLESYRSTIDQALRALRTTVSFDERLKLSQEALTFVRRILAGGNQAPTLLELTPALLAEIQKLREFAGTVRILRAE